MSALSRPRNFRRRLMYLTRRLIQDIELDQKIQASPLGGFCTFILI